jgi:uncharacterized membrane protein
MRFFSRNILTGIVTVLPVLLTLYLLYWFAVTAESALGSLIKSMVEDSVYWPGMGLLVALVVVFLVGLLMHAYVFQRVFAIAENLLYRMPVIRTIYRAMRDFFNYFDPARMKDFDQVVAVELGSTGMQVIGFVTQANPQRLPKTYGNQDTVLVYLPMSYMIGGYAVLMPRSAVRPLDMNLEEAMRFTLTAGVTGVVQSQSKGGKEKSRAIVGE